MAATGGVAVRRVPDGLPLGPEETRLFGGDGVEAAVAAGLLVAAAAILWAAESAVAKVAVAAAAIVATAASGVLRASWEMARRRSHAPALGRMREVRDLTFPGDVDGAVRAVGETLRGSGFAIERVERSHEARVVLARRGGLAFFGSMLVHAGLMFAIGALAVRPSLAYEGLEAFGLIALAAGSALRVICDPQVVWCAAREAHGGTAVEVVVSGGRYPARLARRADELASVLEERFGR
jgi:hypothetical protein